MTDKETKTSCYDPSEGWACTNLRWLIDFMEVTGQTITKLAEKSGYTRQNIGQKLRKDNMMLSTAEKILSGYNCTINISLTKPAKDKSYKTENIIDLSSITDPDIVPFISKRLFFLSQAAKRENLSNEQLAEACGLSLVAFYRILRVDDIDFLKLIKIADAFGFKMTINIQGMK